MTKLIISLLFYCCGWMPLKEVWVSACDCHHADHVTHLPGYNQPLPSPIYSGYLSYTLPSIQQTIRTHYMLIQAESVSSDEEETLAKTNFSSPGVPLIYWSNGGPGASSLFGLWTEIGPLLFSDDSLQTHDFAQTHIPTPLYNPYAWTRLGHILVFEQPAPVGYSYCNDDISHVTCQDIAWTDELTAENAYHALLAFYDKFPCLKNQELYLTGESYAGIYIPTLARAILKGQDDLIQHNQTAIPLVGFAVGDGCLGTHTGICGELSPGQEHRSDIWRVLFLAGHGQIPLETYRQVLKACLPHFLQDDQASETNQEQNTKPKDDSLCQGALHKVKEQAGGYFAYSLYDECIYRNGLLLSHGDRSLVDGALNDYACGGGIVMEQYLKMPVVKEALHVQGEYFSVDNAMGFNYTPTEPDLTGFYKEVNSHLRVLIYNGDTDPAITSFAAQNWTSHLGFNELEGWRPWTVDGCLRVGGYVTRYGGSFDFVTIRGAGHMVPTYKAAATYTFLKAWMSGTDYPYYNENCTSPESGISRPKFVGRDAETSRD